MKAIRYYGYGVYGYMAPILHLRRVEGGDLFDMYAGSPERVWEVSYPYRPDSGAALARTRGENSTDDEIGVA